MLKMGEGPMLKTEYILLILGMGLVTYIPRWFPLFFLTQRKIPQWFVEWLDLIHAAILSALIFSDLFVTGDPHRLEILQLKSMVAIPIFLFALRTKSLGGTVIMGMVLFWLAGRFFGGGI
jgi:branched-subunit amino acid transport protein